MELTIYETEEDGSLVVQRNIGTIGIQVDHDTTILLSPDEARKLGHALLFAAS